MYVLRQKILENFRLLFAAGIIAGVYKITEACACTAAMYGIDIPFIG